MNVPQAEQFCYLSGFRLGRVDPADIYYRRLRRQRNHQGS